MREPPPLKDYQRKNVEKIEGFGGRALLADDMGLGKTCSALRWAFDNLGTGTIVVICPACVKLNWKREAWLHTRERARVLSGMTPPQEIPPKGKRSRIYVVNYDILEEQRRRYKGGASHLKGWLRWLKKLRPKLIIIDEAHKLQSRKSKRTKAVKELCRGVPHVLALSGTPLINRPFELWPTLNILRPDIWTSAWTFGKRYCKPERTPWGWVYRGATRLKELRKRLLEHCFPGNTLIETDRGNLTIKEIVDNEIKAKVCCVDPVSSQVLWRPILAYSNRKAPDRMLRILHESGELTCTPDHLIWTEEYGYTSAEKIVPGIHLRTLQKEKEKEGGGRTIEREILLGKMRCRPQGEDRYIESESSKDNVREGLGRFLEKSSLRKMRKRNCTNSQHTEIPILLDKMRCSVEGVPSPLQSNERGMDERGRNKEGEKGDCHGKNHPGKGESREETQGAKTEPPMETKDLGRTPKKMENSTEGGSKRSSEKNNVRTTKDTTQSDEMGGGATRVLCEDKPTKKRKIPSENNPLSSRGSSRAICETCRGSGREIAQNKQKTNEDGSKKGETAYKSRVDRIEILERGNRHWPFPSDEENQVYDIEVEEHHNFFANGTLVHNCMVRNRKEDVLKELPEKTRKVIPIEIDSGEYTEASQNLVKWLKKNYGRSKAKKALKAERLTRMGYLKRLAARLKLKSVIQWIQDFLDESGEKLIVFGVHKEILGAIQKHFKTRCVLVDGSVSGDNRQELFDRFNRNPACDLLVGNVQAAGVGWSCTSATNVLFAELAWTPGEHTQAEDRIHGLGRGVKGKKAFLWYLVGAGTIEEDLCKILQRKQKNISATLDGGRVRNELNTMDLLTEALTRKEVK